MNIELQALVKYPLSTEPRKARNNLLRALGAPKRRARASGLSCAMAHNPFSCWGGMLGRPMSTARLNAFALIWGAAGSITGSQRSKYGSNKMSRLLP